MGSKKRGSKDRYISAYSALPHVLIQSIKIELAVKYGVTGGCWVYIPSEGKSSRDSEIWNRFKYLCGLKKYKSAHAVLRAVGGEFGLSPRAARHICNKYAKKKLKDYIVVE